MDDDLSNSLAKLRIDREASPPRRWPRLLGGMGAIVIVTAIAWRWGLPYMEASLFKTEVAVTEVATVGPAQALVELSATGHLVPQKVARVGSRLIGRIAKVYIQEGTKIHAGQAIFELDPSYQRSSIAAARARVAAAQARAQTARANRDEIQIQLNRQRTLVSTGSVPQATADDLAARVDALEAAVKSSDAEVKSAEAEMAVLADDLKHTTVKAPMNGTVMTKPAQVGDVVGPVLGPESILVEIADLDSILVEVDVPEGRLRTAKEGAPCEVVLDAYPDKRLRGTVAEIGPKVNRAKASATVKVRILDASEKLRPEMAARVSFLSKPLDEATLREQPKTIVPASALIDVEGRKHVFVIESGKVRRVAVNLGEAFGSGFVLLDGPPSGTRLVKNPSATLRDGHNVKEGAS